VRLEICFQTFSGVLQMGIFDNVLGKKKKETQKGGIACSYCGATQNSDMWSFSDKRIQELTRESSLHKMWHRILDSWKLRQSIL